MKRVIVTGASGFIGYHLVNELQKNSIFVYAIVRPNSKNKVRLDNFRNIKIIELAMQDIGELPRLIKGKVDVFYHLAWEGDRNDFFVQNKNIEYTLKTLEVLKKIGCKRLITTGSQAEYGLHNGVITEDTLAQPNTAYGCAKLAACHLSKFRAVQLEIEWIWTRIFSVYGQYDNSNALIPYLIRSIRKGQTPKLTSCMQNWDFLYASDAAEVLRLLGNKGGAGEVYNIASGDVKPLRYFVEEVRNIIDADAQVIYGECDRMVVSLNPSIEKIKRQIKWEPRVKFSDGIYDIINS